MGSPNVHVQGAPMATGGKKPMSIWWPMGFLIAWVLCCAVGGGLYGAGIAQDYYYCDDYDCYVNSSGSGMATAGLAFLALSGVIGLVFWILLIVWFIKRSHRTHPTVVYAPPPPQQQQQHPGAAPYQVEPLGGVYAEQHQPVYQQQQQPVQQHYAAGGYAPYPQQQHV